MSEELENVTQTPEPAVTKAALLATLQPELEPEEVVLWAETVVVDKRKFALIQFFAVTGMAAVFLLTSSLFTHHFTILNIVTELAFACAAVYFGKQFFDIQKWRMRTRIAVLTNMRALECDSSGSTTIVWYSSPNFGKVESVQNSIDLGDILFATDEESNRTGFRNVPNTAAATEILFRAQAKVKESKSGGME